MEDTTSPVYSIKVLSADKINVQADNTDLISVEFSIVKDDETVVTYAHGFPLATTHEEIVESLNFTLANYVATSEVWKRNEAFAAANAVADDTIASIVGTEITNSSE